MDFIRSINLEMLKIHSCQESYGDDYLFVTDKLDDVFIDAHSIKLDAFLMIYCIGGKIDIELGNTQMRLSVDDLMIILPNKIVRRVGESSDCKMKILCFSNRFTRRLLQTDKNTWKSISYLRANPIRHFEPDESILFNQYLGLIEHKAQRGIGKYQKEVLFYIASAFFGEMISETNEKFLGSSSDSDFLVKQPDFIFKQFMELLSIDNGTHRTLSYYADILGYSSKYLSKIVKQVSGRNALKFIQENALEHIIVELRHSNKSIKEISIAFDFPNVSFFTQYLKKHLGVTPTEFRNHS